jgi:hypothetical protein
MVAIYDLLKREYDIIRIYRPDIIQTISMYQYLTDIWFSDRINS